MLAELIIERLVDEFSTTRYKYYDADNCSSPLDWFIKRNDAFFIIIAFSFFFNVSISNNIPFTGNSHRWMAINIRVQIPLTSIGLFITEEKHNNTPGELSQFYERGGGGRDDESNRNWRPIKIYYFSNFPANQSEKKRGREREIKEEKERKIRTTWKSRREDRPTNNKGKMDT